MSKIIVATLTVWVEGGNVGSELKVDAPFTDMHLVVASALNMSSIRCLCAFLTESRAAGMSKEDQQAHVERLQDASGMTYHSDCIEVKSDPNTN